MFSRALFNRAAAHMHTSAAKCARRMYSIEESSMHVKRAAKPPIFEDVVPTTPTNSLRRRRRDVNNTVSTLSSLDKPMPHLPQVVELEPTSFAHTVTTLSNGVRVISQQSVDTGAVVGIALDAGTRHEREAERGSTLLAERLAFKSPKTDAAVQQLRALGSTFSPFYTRDVLAWMVECLPDQVIPALGVVAETVVAPHFDPDAVQQTKEDVALQIADYRNAPAQFVPEMLHAIAFGSHADAEGGVGRPLLCSARDIEQLTASAAEQFLQRRLIGPRVVVIGHGVDHSVLVGHAKQLVGALPKASAVANGGAPTRASAYRGGSHSLEATADDQNVTHIAVAFEGARAGSPESYVSCLLQLLLGGGDSFSTGGPGKGMHSMLYRDVLVRYGQVQTCVAFNHCYGDTGLFGVFASASDTTAQVLTEVVLTELAIVARGVSDEAFARAKNQLKGHVLMNIESRLVLFEDMARQMVVSGQYVDPATVCEHIDAVTVQDLSAFVTRAMQARPSYLAFGPKAAIASAPDAAALHRAAESLLK